jgi:hypothetical protein
MKLAADVIFSVDISMDTDMRPQVKDIGRKPREKINFIPMPKHWNKIMESGSATKNPFCLFRVWFIKFNSCPDNL